MREVKRERVAAGSDAAKNEIEAAATAGSDAVKSEAEAATAVGSEVGMTGEDTAGTADGKANFGKKTRTRRTKKAEPEPDERSIDEIFSELDRIIGKLEEGEISLEDSFRYYEEGIRLVKCCSGKIDRVEKQILVLNDTAVEE